MSISPLISLYVNVLYLWKLSPTIFSRRQKLEIVDPDRLLPDKGLIEKVIKDHPLNANLFQHIETVVIKEIIINPNTNQSENIYFNPDNKEVTLNIFNITPQKTNYEYILYHEISHVADKCNVNFGFYESKKKELTGNEQFYVMELWNLYIDSRLNMSGLFCIGDNNSCDYKEVKGSIKPIRNWKRLNGGQRIRDEIWENPNNFLSYDDLIRIVKDNLI